MMDKWLALSLYSEKVLQSQSWAIQVFSVLRLHVEPDLRVDLLGLLQFPTYSYSVINLLITRNL